jgi:hypothetical protein
LKNKTVQYIYALLKWLSPWFTGQGCIIVFFLPLIQVLQFSLGREPLPQKFKLMSEYKEYNY